MGRYLWAFLIDSPPDLFRHRHEAVAIAPPGDVISLDGQAYRASGNHEYKYTLTFLLKQFEINTHMQLADEPLARPLRLLEGLAAYDFARSLVRYPEHNATAAMIGYGAGVLDVRRTQRSLNSTFSPS